MLMRGVRLAVLLVAAIWVLALGISAQPEGYVEVPKIQNANLLLTGCILPENGVYDEAKLKAARRDKDCGEEPTGLKFDFERQTLIGYSAHGDCHMQVATKVFRNDAEKKYKAIINNIYGGCRAGGSRRGWIVIEKIRAGYDLDVVEVRVDRIHGPTLGGFLFPEPPAIVTRVPLEIREVDLKGCLSTTGQSQWVISKPEHLENALNGNEPEKERCREHLRSLNINFQNETLLQYAFASGHCARPPGLAIEAVKETSSNLRSNRFLLKFSYDDAGENYCKVWTTYPVWVIVPKVPPTYSVAFEATKNSAAGKPPAQDLETRQVNLEGCIQTHFTRQFVIRSKAALLAAIRNDASRERCVKNAEAIDLEKYTLVGMELNTGYCRTPVGLEYRTTRDDANKRYTLSIGWEPHGAICRALSEYDLWVLVPKMPSDYGQVFDLKSAVGR